MVASAVEGINLFSHCRSLHAQSGFFGLCHFS